MQKHLSFLHSLIRLLPNEKTSFILKRLVVENFDYKFQILVGELVALRRFEWFCMI